MNSYEKLKNSITKAGNLLCVGLDTDINKMPDIFSKNVSGLIDFNKTIIEATKDLAASYKINFAFYEQYGTDGFQALKKTFEMLPSSAFSIADAKRGDIGNTSNAYAKSVFEYFGADSITVNPYMGYDSINPFFEFPDKMVFILALTSNKGSWDYQKLICDGKEIYKYVIEKTSQSFDIEQTGYVVGATHPSELAEIRKIIPDHTLLLPGVGAQGGNIAAVMKANNNGPALINVSRAVIYPKGTSKFEDLVRNQAEFFAHAMKV